MSRASTHPDFAVMHFEVTRATATLLGVGPTATGRSACGRELPTAGFFTDDLGIVEDRAGSRCKACWRVLVARGLVEVDS